MLQPNNCAMLLAAAVMACGQGGTASESASQASVCPRSVEAAIDELEELVTAEAWGEMIDLTMPAPLLSVVADGSGLPEGTDPELLRSLLVSQVSAIYEEAKVIEYEVSREAVDVRRSPSGRQYALIPTQMDLEVREMLLRSASNSLALENDDCWYIVDPSDDQLIAYVRSAFPDLAMVELQPSVTEVVEP